MLSVVRFLVQCPGLCGAYSNENSILCEGLGCKRSQVQILSRRPVYLLEIIQYCVYFYLCTYVQEVATKLSKNTAFAWVCGIVFGTPRSEPFQGHALSLSQSSLVNSNEIHQHVNRGIYGMRSCR